MEAKLERFKLVMKVLLYPAGLFHRHPILSLLALMGFSLFAQVYKIAFLANLLHAYITISLMTFVIGLGLVSRNKWITGGSIVAALIIMFTPLLIDLVI
jgi:hypothetical protein